MKKLFLTPLLTIIAVFLYGQNLSPESRLSVNTISNLLLRMKIKDQYTQPIGIEEFATIRQEYDGCLENYNTAIIAWNKIPKSEHQHPDVQTVRKPLADYISFFQKWTNQLKATQKIINENPQVLITPNIILSETSKKKLTQISSLLASIEPKKEFSSVLVPAQYVPAAEWFLKIKGNYLKATALLASLQKVERPHPDALKEEEKILAIQDIYLNVEKQLKAVSTAQTNSGIRKMWAEDTEKYLDAVLIFADVLGIDLPQNTSNGATLFELKPDNYDKTINDLEALSLLMTGNYKDLVDNFSNVFPTLSNSPCVFRMVSVNRKALIPEVVKLSAKRFMANAMHGAPDMEDLEQKEGWMDGSFTPLESKKRLAEVKSRFIPVLKKSGINEKEAGLDQLDTVYNSYWRKAEALAPKWTFPSDADAAGDVRAKALFTNNIKAAYPGVQIIKLGFAYYAKWTIYLNAKNQPKHRTIGTTALIKIPGEKFYTTWQLLFNEDYIGGGKFSGGAI